MRVKVGDLKRLIREEVNVKDTTCYAELAKAVQRLMGYHGLDPVLHAIETGEGPAGDEMRSLLTKAVAKHGQKKVSQCMEVLHGEL